MLSTRSVACSAPAVCSSCRTVVHAEHLTPLFCASCGSSLIQMSANGSASEPTTRDIDARRAVIGQIARYHADRFTFAAAEQKRSQNERDDYGKKAIVLEAQVEALRRLLRTSTDGTGTEARVSRARAARRGEQRVATARSALPCAHSFSKTVAPAPALCGTSRTRIPLSDAGNLADTVEKAESHRQHLLDQL